MKVHRLKTHPIYFKYVLDGSKPWEFRENDRNFQVGDFLLLQEWCPESKKYSGRECLKQITYIAEGHIIPAKFCVMTIQSPPGSSL